MPRYRTIAIALLLASCDQHRGPEPANDQTANLQASAEVAGAKEAQDAVQRTRIDTLESRVTRLEAEVATMEAQRDSALDLKNAMSQLNAQQAPPMARPAQDKPPAPKPESVAGPPATP